MSLEESPKSEVAQDIEIIYPKQVNYRKYLGWGIVSLFLVLFIFFAVRAYSVARKVIVSRSGTASPLLVDDIEKFIQDPNFISNLDEGDRRVNILLLGVGGGDHPGAYLTDTTMIASVDVKNKSVAMLSIPRDLYVPVEGYYSTKINGVYSLAFENGEENVSQGVELLKNTITDIFDIPIHYFVLVDFEGFKKAIDSLGGIDVEVAESIYDPYYPDKNDIGYDPFYLDDGLQHMDGETVLKYARSRHDSSDFARAKRQQDILVVLKEKVMQGENVLSVKKINELISILSDNIKTDLQIGEIGSLYKILKDISGDDIASKVLDNSVDSAIYADNYDGAYVLVPNDPSWGEVKEFVRQYFKDPFLVEENARISVRNGTTVAGLGTTLGDQLESFGYNVVDVSNADNKNYENTFIYDYSNNKKKRTLEFLQKKLNNAQVVRLDDESSPWDIEIIIGKDFKDIK